MTRTGLIAVAAMLAGGIGVAAAQTSTPSTSPGATGRCWDTATNQVRNAAGGSTLGGSASTSTMGGGASTSGSTATRSTGTGSSTGSTSTAPTGAGSSGSMGANKARPAEALGLPDCPK